MIDIFTIPIPETHIWPVFFGWMGLYVGGRLMMRGLL